MKKLISILSFALIATGCSFGNTMDNTPTKKVEEYLNNYQTLNSDVLDRLDAVVDDEIDFEENQKDTYKDILKKHYQDLTYTIKEETVNGDKATVEAEIEVTDYTKALKEAETYKEANESKFADENGNFDKSKFSDYKLDLLKKSTEKVKYTIYFSLTKSGNAWKLDDLNDIEDSKLLGIYEY